MEVVFNRHRGDFSQNTLEFNVKNPNLDGVDEDVYEHEYTTGSFTNSYADQLFSELNYSWLCDWSFAGRMNGWFVLLTSSDLDSIPQRTISRIERIVKKYFDNYNKNLKKYYKINCK
jgi:hypothetical protein